VSGLLPTRSLRDGWGTRRLPHVSVARWDAIFRGGGFFPRRQEISLAGAFSPHLYAKYLEGEGTRTTAAI